MNTLIIRNLALALVASATLGLAPNMAAAKASQSAEVENDRIAAIETALGEQRYVDAGRMIDQSLLSGGKNPLFLVLAGELNLARGRYEPALRAFKRAGTYSGATARSLQGQGVALALLGRSDEALNVLKQAVSADPAAWRAWNALGGEYDRRRDWKSANEAYERALETSNRAAIVLNNRGFSRMLQGSLETAIPDLVEALEKRPDLAAARTNLRLAMGLKGEYDRALASGPQEERAALLNNVGYAALLRGDQERAEALFNQAIVAKGQFYERAANNLQTVNGMASTEAH